MSLGAMVRRSFGPYEPQIADLYRKIFIDLDAFVDQMRAWTDATRILEIGAGEGVVTERLLVRYPTARITAIDIAPSVGRLFRGDPSRVEFRQAPVDDVVATQPASFDLVILADVIHHVPVALRAGILVRARAALKPGGMMVFKDWTRRPTPIHLACALSDRLLTGDDVHYLNEAELRALARKTFGDDAIIAEGYVRPWKNNFAMLLRGEQTPR
jgi:2-polyprenyl-6-hydroxyphenyl methylase/3-demethylubiquinone-9 3-methyltransferase